MDHQTPHPALCATFPSMGRLFSLFLLPYLARKVSKEKQSSLLPIIPGDIITITSMVNLLIRLIRTFLLCYSVGHFNFALTKSRGSGER